MDHGASLRPAPSERSTADDNSNHNRETRHHARLAFRKRPAHPRRGPWQRRAPSASCLPAPWHRRSLRHRLCLRCQQGAAHRRRKRRVARQDGVARPVAQRPCPDRGRQGLRGKHPALRRPQQRAESLLAVSGRTHGLGRPAPARGRPQLRVLGALRAARRCEALATPLAQLSQMPLELRRLPGGPACRLLPRMRQALPHRLRRAHRRHLRRRQLRGVGCPDDRARPASLPRLRADPRAQPRKERQGRGRVLRPRQALRLGRCDMHHGLHLHDGLDGQRRRREDHPRHRARDRRAPPAHHLHRKRRRAHARGLGVAHADGQDHRSARGTRPRRTALLLRHHRPDDGRRHRLLRDARRRHHRRAGRAHRLCRQARHPRHHQADPASCSRSSTA